MKTGMVFMPGILELDKSVIKELAIEHFAKGLDEEIENIRSGKLVESE